MLIIEIALGIVVAVLILALWQHLLAGAAILLVGGILLFLLLSVLGNDNASNNLGLVIVFAGIAWMVMEVRKKRQAEREMKAMSELPPEPIPVPQRRRRKTTTRRRTRKPAEE